jgi:hypothetical protein
MTVSVRSYLTVGVAALAASAVAVAPVHAPAPQSATTAAVRLSAAAQPLVQPIDAAAAVLGLVSTPAPAKPAAATTTPQAAATANASAGDAIINAYNAIEPWVQWGFEVGAWAVGWVPYAGYFGSQINIAYNTGEPLVQSWVYSFAYLIDGNVSLIGPTLVNGIKQSVTNLVQGEIQWILGYLPPLPPIPPFAAAQAGPAAAATALAAAVTAPTASPRSVNPAHALRTPLVAAVEDAVAPATDAVERTKKTVVDPTDVQADLQEQDSADATETDAPQAGTQDVNSGRQDSVKDTVKKVRSAAGSARGHSEKKRAAHDSGN